MAWAAERNCCSGPAKRLKVDRRHSVFVVWRGFPSGIRHGKKCRLMAFLPHEPHQIEKVNLGCRRTQSCTCCNRESAWTLSCSPQNSLQERITEVSQGALEIEEFFNMRACRRAHRFLGRVCSLNEFHLPDKIGDGPGIEEKSGFTVRDKFWNSR